MSIKAMIAVMESDLPATQRFVALILADRAHDDGSSIRPGAAFVARRTGLDDSTVKRSMAWLRKHGVIVQVRPATPRRPAEYRLVLPGLEQYQGAERTPDTQDRGAQRTPGVPSAPVTITEPSSANTHPSSRGDKKPTKPLPPAVLVMRQAGARPRTDWYDRIAEAIGDSPEALERLGGLVEEWVGRGYNPYNTVGILDAFKAGGNLAGPKPAHRESRADREAKMKREQEHYRGLKNGKKPEGGE